MRKLHVFLLVLCTILFYSVSSVLLAENTNPTNEEAASVESEAVLPPSPAQPASAPIVIYQAAPVATQTIEIQDDPAEPLVSSNDSNVITWISRTVKKKWRKVANFMNKRYRLVLGLRQKGTAPDWGKVDTVEVMRVKYNTIPGGTYGGVPNKTGVAAINPKPSVSSPFKLGQIVWTAECSWMLISDIGSGNRKGDFEIVGPCGRAHNGQKIQVYLVKDVK